MQKNTWRVRIGTWMFFLPVVSLVLAPIVVPLLGFSAGTTAALVGGIVIGGEIIWFLSIPLLGKEGFTRLKKQLFGFIRLPAGPISRSRHRLGICMFLGSFVAETLVAFLLIYVYFHYAPGKLPEETLMGMEFETQALLFVLIQGASAVCLAVSVFVLGAPFFQRLQDAFRWHPSDRS